ncbi:MAG: GTPase HflX [Calditrichaeota bacterium]|nr:GTPase HflX [Calditrichota bacterium]
MKKDQLTAHEKAILVGVILPRQTRWEVEENLSELQLLARTAGVQVVDKIMQDRDRINPTYFIGSGKVEQLAQLVKMHGVTAVIFDDDLTPAQVRNLEKATGVKIIDRSTLILDIFAKHARTREAKTQVELAQLQYLLPRLTRQWTHLSRQVGGIGTKGPGETQLETDRRLIRKRIEFLRKELSKIDQQRSIRRKRREGIFKASLIGYTNVGKSTIMNLLSNAGVTVEDQLFATLDSTVRRVWLDRDHQILLSDTVGFIRKLPHHLVASFKSTLDEVRDADLLLHVVDISHPQFKEQIQTVNHVLQEIGVADKPVLMIFNKIDRLKEKHIIGALKAEFPGSVFISAARHIQIEYLKRVLIDFIEKHYVEGEVVIPLQFSGLISLVHDLGIVESENFSDSVVTIQFRSTIPNKYKILRHVRETIRDYRNQVRA